MTAREAIAEMRGTVDRTSMGAAVSRLTMLTWLAAIEAELDAKDEALRKACEQRDLYKQDLDTIHGDWNQKAVDDAHTDNATPGGTDAGE